MGGQSIRRKDFLTLTITFATLGMTAVGCGDDDDDSVGGGGSAGKGGGGASAGSGNGGANGGTGNTAGTSTAGTTSGGGGTDGGGTEAGGTEAGGGGTGAEGGGGPGPVDGGGAGAGPGPGPGNGGGGEGGGGAGNGGSGGMAGDGPTLGGGAGAGGASGCIGATLTRTASSITVDPTHDHITVANEQALTLYINDDGRGATFTLATEFGHTHTISLTGPQIESLRSGGTVTGVQSSDAGPTGYEHHHTYTIECG